MHRYELLFFLGVFALSFPKVYKENGGFGWTLFMSSLIAGLLAVIYFFLVFLCAYFGFLIE